MNRAVVTRVVFIPRGTRATARLRELGETETGVFGQVDDDEWLGSADAAEVQLLYLSTDEYAYAVRKLPAPEIALAVECRRRTFAREIVERALSEVAARVGTCLSTHLPRETGDRLRSDLLSALASFTVVPRLKYEPPLELLDMLRGEAARLVGELAEPMLRTDGNSERLQHELSLRLEMESALGQLGADLAGLERVWPLPRCVDPRVYLIVPTTPELERRAFNTDEPTFTWSGGWVAPMSDRRATELANAGYRLSLLFASRGSMMEALAEITSAQREVVMAEHDVARSFARYTQRRRVDVATMREGVRIIAGGDPKIDAMLTRQTAAEVQDRNGWTLLAPSVSEATSLEQEIFDAISTAKLLSSIARRARHTAVVGWLDGLGRAISQIKGSAGI